MNMIPSLEIARLRIIGLYGKENSHSSTESNIIFGPSIATAWNCTLAKILLIFLYTSILHYFYLTYNFIDNLENYLNRNNYHDQVFYNVMVDGIML